MDGEDFRLSPDRAGEGHKAVNMEEKKQIQQNLEDQAEDEEAVSDPLMQGLANEVVAQAHEEVE